MCCSTAFFEWLFRRKAQRFRSAVRIGRQGAVHEDGVPVDESTHGVLGHEAAVLDRLGGRALPVVVVGCGFVGEVGVAGKA